MALQIKRGIHSPGLHEHKIYKIVKSQLAAANMQISLLLNLHKMSCMELHKTGSCTLYPLEGQEGDGEGRAGLGVRPLASDSGNLDQFTVLPQTSCVTLGLSLSMPRFTLCVMVVITLPYLTGLL